MCVGVSLLFLVGLGAVLSFSILVVCVGLVLLSFLGWLGPFACLCRFRSGLGHCPLCLSGVSSLSVFVVAVGPYFPSVFVVLWCLAVHLFVAVLLLL